MKNIIWLIIIPIAVLIILIFAIAQYAKESKLRKICKKIAEFLLLGVITLSDEDRKSFFRRN